MLSPRGVWHPDQLEGRMERGCGSFKKGGLGIRHVAPLPFLSSASLRKSHSMELEFWGNGEKGY